MLFCLVVCSELWEDHEKPNKIKLFYYIKLIEESISTQEN